MIREVNLIGHLPSYMQGYREIQGIMNAENPELQLVEDASESIRNNMFVTSADEVGIARYEKMLGLTPSADDTLANRQTRVLAQYTNTVTYTLRGLMDRLEIICGVGNYAVILKVDEYKIDIAVRVRIKDLIKTIDTMLANMIPANMICTYSVIQNSHNDLSQYPHYLLAQFKHQELFDAVIDVNISSTCDNITNYTMESFESVSCENMANFGMRKV